MVSVERINQYCGITSEAPPVIENSRPAESWPTQGSIQFQHLQVHNSHLSVDIEQLSTLSNEISCVSFILKKKNLFIDSLPVC